MIAATERSRWDLQPLLDSLPARASVDAPFHATELPGRARDFLARDEVGRPLMLLWQGGDMSRALPVQLRNISVEFNTLCRVIATGPAPIEERFVVIRCESDDPPLFRFFLAAGAAMLSQLPQPSTERDIRAYVDGFVELFRLLNGPSTRSVAGLWAELLIMASADEASRWVEAWHTKARDKHDFSFGTVKYEVKSSRSGSRLHDFSLEQVSLPSGEVGCVLSVLLRNDAGGTSLLDLARELADKARPSPDAVAKIWSNIAEVIGEDLSAVEELRFDRRYSEQSIRAISSDAVPRPTVTDARVQQVRFCVDLTAIADSGLALPAALRRVA